jgi:crotonobetainyl-CoA:carnitine CoA-transferase CaiB-like acyl-CoA transferase
VRVLDFSIIWAGPMCARLLGDLGAEIIKIEATVRMDIERGAARAPGVERPYNKRGRFNEYNRNKLGITVNLKHPDGPALVRELVKVSDMVIENFSTGVLDRLGFGYEDLKKLRPDIVMVSMPGFGGTGPDRMNVAYGPTQEAMSGFHSLTGYLGGPPAMTGVLYGDPSGGVSSAAAAMMALWHARHTGEGCHLDISQQEALMTFVPEVMLEYELAGRIIEPNGNRARDGSVQGCYRSAGDDAWIVIAVQDDAQWRGLCRVMGHPELEEDERFVSREARLRNHDAFDALVGGWTADKDHYELMNLLQAQGVPAQAVLKLPEVMSDPHYVERGFFQMIDHADAGVQPHGSAPWQFGGAFLPILKPAPMLGEHNEDVFGGILGLPQSELARLESEGVIGKVPVGGEPD